MRSLTLLAAAWVCTAADERLAERERLLRDLRADGIKSEAVLKAMRDVPRHRFVPPAVQFAAYRNAPLHIGYGQTISQPYIVALMTELLAAGARDRVLEIGTGSGYQAAILAKLAIHVYTIEIVPALGEQARKVLEAEGIRNVTVRIGDGYKGWPDQAPFDRVILTAAPPELPQALVDQLKPGGRLVAPVGRQGDAQELLVVEKDAKGRISRRSVLPVLFVPMVPKPEK